MEALWLKSQKLSHKDIYRLTGISPNTLRGYLRAYLKGGIEALKELNFYMPQSELCEHTTTFEILCRV
jgi:Fic family protein